jgi:hypothetical protein
MLALILATIAGRASLAALFRAHCRDLGDDQDDLTTSLSAFAQEDPAAARSIPGPWAEASDKDLRRTAIWLLGYVPEPADPTLLTQAARDPDEGAEERPLVHHTVEVVESRTPTATGRVGRRPFSTQRGAGAGSMNQQ